MYFWLAIVVAISVAAHAAIAWRIEKRVFENGYGFWKRHARRKMRRKYGQKRRIAQIMNELRKVADEAIVERKAAGKSAYETETFEPNPFSKVLMVHEPQLFVEAGPLIPASDPVLCVQVSRDIRAPCILLSTYYPKEGKYPFGPDLRGLEDLKCVIAECIRAA